MRKSILVSEIARRVSATEDDIQSLDPVWQGMMRRDDDGRMWVSEDRQGYILGALDAAVDCRRDERIKKADANLVSHYRALTSAGRRSAPGLQGAAQEQKQMLKTVSQVLDALMELVDAKVDARRMRPETAAQIRAEVDLLRHDARQNTARALLAIRSLLDLAS
ncbi:hypothetical protein OHV08_34090 [Streptomyces canus]|uniref:hypothetical protein n=1 Tax=Streptomyces canus TaxID=58343 RepID=UPI0032555AD6